MQKLLRPLFIIYCFLLATSVLAQNQVTLSPIYVEFNNPNQTGLILCAYKLTPTLSISKIGDAAELRLSFKVDESTPQNLNRTYEYRYRYYGQEYTDRHVGTEVFNSIRTDRAFLNFKILVQGNGHQLEMQSFQIYNGGWTMGRVPTNAKASDYSVYVQAMTGVAHTGTKAIEDKIIALRRAEKNLTDYNNYIQKADAAFNAKRWIDAKYAYQSAKSVLPDKPYPQNQIDKIEGLIKKEADDKAAAAQKAKDDALAAAQKKKDDALAAQQKRDADARNNNNSSASTSSGSSGSSGKSGYGNSSSSGTSSSGGSSSGYTGSSNSTATTSGTVNKPQPRNDLPDLFKTTDGKFYKKDSYGQPYEVNYDQYQAAKAERAAARQPAPTPQKSDAEIVAETQALLQKSTDEFLDNIKKTQERDARQTQRYITNAQDREVVNAAKENIEDISNLRGVYESVDELNRDFNAQYSQISSSISDLTEARNREWNSRVDANFAEGDETTKAIGEGAKLLGNIVNNINEEKERKAYQEQLRQQRAAQEREIVERKRQMILGVRNNLISKYKEGHIPLSSQKVKADRLFYFIYAYDKATISTDRPEMYVSNVFEIGRYSDGTWPFKSSINNEIQNLTPYPETMHGYYKTQEEAEEMQQAFKEWLVKGEVSIKPCTFKGKKTTITASNSNTDFWGNEKNKPGQDPNQNQTQTPELDFWGNPIKKPEPVPSPATDVVSDAEIEYSPDSAPATQPVQTQPEPVKQQSTELDFWGNPVK